jgi:hypothetical protein
VNLVDQCFNGVYISVRWFTVDTYDEDSLRTIPAFAAIPTQATGST